MRDDPLPPLPPPGVVHGYLPPGRKAAVVLTVDDVFPGRRGQPFEAGGELERGAIGRLLWLLNRHPRLHITLFVTPDWRETTPVPTSALRHLPWVRERVFLAPTLPKGTMDLRRHGAFVQFLNALPRTELALHGLHHIHRGPRIAVEFQQQDLPTCAAMLREAMGIMDEAGLAWSRGLQPPGWNTPPALRQAAADCGLRWVASGRDLRSAITPAAVLSEGHGVAGASLLYPERLPEGLLHFSSNFQATLPAERAFGILDCGGILAIKAHITKVVPGHMHADGVDRLYMNYLDQLFCRIEDRYGDDIEWTTMGAIARYVELADDAAPALAPECVEEPVRRESRAA